MPLAPNDLARLIADDHTKLQTILERMQRGEGNLRVQADVVVHDLSVHAAAEEMIVYPALREQAGLTDAADALIAEHRTMKELLVTITRAAPETAEFDEALGALTNAVMKHVPDEEDHLLPLLRAAIADEGMQALGDEFVAAKRTAPTHAHPRAPATPPANRILGIAAALVDKVRDLATGRVNELATDGSGLLDTQAQAVVDAFAKLRPTPIELLTPEEARRQPTPADAVRAVLRARKRDERPEPVASVEEIRIPSPDYEIPARVYTPLGVDESAPLPLLIYLHGGGWVIADLDVYDASPRALANRARCIVVSVAYRHAPEHRFPAAHDDVLEATRWIMHNAAALGGDPERVAISGESAGGNLAASTCLALHRAGERMPVFQLLVYPVTRGAGDMHSYEDSSDAVPLNLAAMRWFTRFLFTTPEDAHDPRIDLLSIPAIGLAGLPPTLVITAERDPLRDEGTAFAQHLEQAGVSVTHAHFHGVMHEFFGMSAVLDKAREAVALSAQHLQRAFAAHAH